MLIRSVRYNKWGKKKKRDSRVIRESELCTIVSYPIYARKAKMYDVKVFKDQ